MWHPGVLHIYGVNKQALIPEESAKITESQGREPFSYDLMPIAVDFLRTIFIARQLAGCLLSFRLFCEIT